MNEGRAFNKPLLYDQETDQVFPDFVLTDCVGGEVPMEVFGRNDEDYLKRKAEKTALYDARHGRGGWWFWEASAGARSEDVPPFPPASRSTPK